ncbi:SAC3/GANP family protein, partial [Teladorsagia circumcincta]
LQGKTFDTEAEFRGYYVMLHLHDSNIMRQVLSYRKEVRESQPVRLALQLSGALQNKNYVRFFRLLKKEATYLQCCICHRYFNTVLSNALHTMMTAYGRHSAFLLEISYLLRVLAWDDREDALNSLIPYGVEPNNLNYEQVFFNHDTFVQDPDAPMRPFRWIDAKNNVSWSQVVYGPAPFSFFSIAVMTDSFDDSGRYNKDPVLSAVFEKYSLQSEAQRLLFAEQNQAPVKPASIATMRQEHHEARSWVTSTVENVVREVADEESFTICKDANVEGLAASISGGLVDEFL